MSTDDTQQPAPPAAPRRYDHMHADKKPPQPAHVVLTDNVDIHIAARERAGLGTMIEGKK